MARVLVILAVSILLSRWFWRAVVMVVRNLAASPPADRGHAPQSGLSMVRDPVCGTFVLPDRAVTIVDGRQRVFFCSNACRDKYRARTA